MFTQLLGAVATVYGVLGALKTLLQTRQMLARRSLPENLGAMTTTPQFPTTVLSSRFDGQVLTPGAPGYDSARSVWNAMIDHCPKLIVRCASVRDVVAAVRTARERNLEIGVRCGGHNIAGLAVPHGGLMIDLTTLASVTVDPVVRRARVQGGAMLGALDRATRLRRGQARAFGRG